MFENFWGNGHVTHSLARMIEQDRIAQTLLFAGPEGVGKATLARRFAARLLGDPSKIEQDDLSLSHNLEIIAGRERWPADKRNQDPLLFASHPDFVTFAPDGPLRQISIEQMRLLKERAPFKPLKGKHRIFLIDHIDRAGEQAANSLLKTLEEPPEHLILIEMTQFAAARALDHEARRIALAAGSPGVAVSLDLEVYDRRRAAMLVLLEVAAGASPFGAWIPYSETIARSKNEKLELYLKVLYDLLRDLLILQQGAGAVRNEDVRPELDKLARKLSFHWIRAATGKVDELAVLLRRNIQKTIALDDLILELRTAA